MFITCTYIPGEDNIIPDRESRKEYKEAEWMLNKNIYLNCLNKLKFEPTIDCFASRINTQHTVYASFRPDPYATFIDAFSINWSIHNCYLFPPFSLVARVLQKSEQFMGLKRTLLCNFSQTIENQTCNMITRITIQLLPSCLGDTIFDGSIVV